VTRRSSFTKAQVARAAAGAIKAGLTVGRIEIDAAGKIVIICRAPEQEESRFSPEEGLARLRSELDARTARPRKKPLAE